MENYNDSFYNGGGPVTLQNPLLDFAQNHPVTTLVFAIIGVIAIIIVVIYFVSKMYAVMFGTDSFVGSYMHWRPNVQDKSELDAIMHANQVEPPMQFPMGLLKNGIDPAIADTNLGSY